MRLSAGWIRCEQIVERQTVAGGNHNLAIEHERVRLEFRQLRGHLWKISRERFAGFRLQLDFFAASKGEAAKAVPFGFVLPLGADWDVVDRGRFHGGQWHA